MTKDRKSYETDDIERLLSPRCDFHPSPDFKERVMRSAGVMSTRPRRKVMPWIAAVSSAAAAIALLLCLPLLRNNDIKNENAVAVSVPAPAAIQDKEVSTLKTSTDKPELLAEAKPASTSATSKIKKAPVSERVSDNDNYRIDSSMPYLPTNETPDREEMRMIGNYNNVSYTLLPMSRDSGIIPMEYDVPHSEGRMLAASGSDNGNDFIHIVNPENIKLSEAEIAKIRRENQLEFISRISLEMDVSEMEARSITKSF